VSSLGFMFRLDFGAGRAFKPQRPALGVGAALLGVTGTTTDAALFGDGNRSCGSHLGNGMRLFLVVGVLVLVFRTRGQPPR
jgi:hypothetical protein